MFTINLEKKMVSGNSLSKKEEVLLKEHKSLAEAKVDTKVLSRLGMANTIEEGNKIVDQLNSLAKYEKTRVFHINQIEKICKKYDLRFLPCQYYKGHIDPLLTERVEGFEQQYKFNSKGAYYNGQYNSPYYIAAPKNSFALEQRPKDPLFFAKIGDNHWYLVHKWGNDLSILRRIRTFLCIDKDSWISFVVFAFIALLIISISTHPQIEGDHKFNDYWNTNINLAWTITRNTGIVCFILAIVTNILQYRSGLSKWNSKFKD